MKETRHRIVILSDFIYVKLYGKRPALICDRKQGGKVTDCKEVWVTTLTNGNGSVFWLQCGYVGLFVKTHQTGHLK